jgi:hypothetical protein
MSYNHGGGQPLLFGADWTYLYYNTDFGWMDAWVHGLKNGFLKKEDYTTLAQCGSLDGWYYFFNPRHESSP